MAACDGRLRPARAFHLSQRNTGRHPARPRPGALDQLRGRQRARQACRHRPHAGRFALAGGRRAGALLRPREAGDRGHRRLGAHRGREPAGPEHAQAVRCAAAGARLDSRSAADHRGTGRDRSHDEPGQRRAGAHGDGRRTGRRGAALQHRHRLQSPRDPARPGHAEDAGRRHRRRARRPVPDGGPQQGCAEVAGRARRIGHDRGGLQRPAGPAVRIRFARRRADSGFRGALAALRLDRRRRPAALGARQARHPRHDPGVPGRRHPRGDRAPVRAVLRTPDRRPRAGAERRRRRTRA